MKDYWLAKLISSVTEVDSRKRLQKSIYLLQQAGCPLQCDYILHYYGPYSFELAALIDQLDGAKIIEETPEATGYGSRYESRITEKGRKILHSIEETEDYCIKVHAYTDEKEHLIQRLLKYGCNCEVIFPKETRELMKQIIIDTLNNYDT